MDSERGTEAESMGIVPEGGEVRTGDAIRAELTWGRHGGRSWSKRREAPFHKNQGPEQPSGLA